MQKKTFLIKKIIKHENSRRAFSHHHQLLHICVYDSYTIIIIQRKRNIPIESLKSRKLKTKVVSIHHFASAPLLYIQYTSSPIPKVTCIPKYEYLKHNIIICKWWACGYSYRMFVRYVQPNHPLITCIYYDLRKKTAQLVCHHSSGGHTHFFFPKRLLPPRGT